MSGATGLLDPHLEALAARGADVRVTAVWLGERAGLLGGREVAARRLARRLGSGS
ncbi:MAG TPA: hypothetical protein VE270_07190 [Thermoleophilaceae bacterium]|nr:hypothetical protein [Thermoleophilaceae bacterium]